MGASSIEYLPHVTLITLFALNAGSLAQDGREYRDFKGLKATEDRQRYFKKWFFKALVIYTLVPLACLALLGRLSALWTFPTEMNGLSAEATRLLSRFSATKYVAWIPGLALGYLLMVLVMTFLEHRESKTATTTMVNKNIQPMVPLNRAERFWTTLLAVNAGVGEEICFRLLVPLLLVLTLGHTILAAVLAAAWFGAIHLYQGIAGIVATSLLAIALLIVYLHSQHLWPVVALHLALNTAQLSFAPCLIEYLDRGG